MLANVKLKTGQHYSSMSIRIIRLILTQGARRCSPTLAHSLLFGTGWAPGAVQLTTGSVITPLSQIAPLKNITFQYKKLHYKLLHCKFNTLKRNATLENRIRISSLYWIKWVDGQLLQQHSHWECWVLLWHGMEVGPPSQTKFLRLVHWSS